MNPSWVLISYDSSDKPLRAGRQDNVYVVDAREQDKKVVEIYVFDGPIRQEGFETIRANVEGSRYLDKGYLFYPKRRHEKIIKYFSIFENTKLEHKTDDESNQLALQLFEKMEKISQFPITKKDLELDLYEMISESTNTLPAEVIKFVAGHDPALLVGYQNLPDEIQQEVIVGIQNIASELLPHDDKIKRLFGRMQRITDSIASGAELMKVLEVILDGVLQTFGDKPLAASICGFDESLPPYYQFDPKTYIVKGADKIQKKNMTNPPRLGKHIHPVDGKLWPGTATQVMEYQRYKAPSQRPVFISDIKRWPDWMPPLRDPKDPKLASTAYIPLIVSNQRVGIIILQFSAHHTFQNDEKQELNLYAKTASSILFNAQMEGRLRHSFHGIKRLEEVTNQSIGSINIKNVISKVAELVLEMGFTGLALHLLPETIEKQNQTYFAASDSELGTEIPASYSSVEFPIGYWEKTLESMFDRQISDNIWCLGYALEAQSRKLGLLLVLRSSKTKLEVSPFLDYEKEWVASLALQLTIIIDDIGRKERLANKSVVISNIARIISDDPGVAPVELVDAVSQELVSIYKEKDFYITFYDPGTDEIRYQVLFRAGRFVDMAAFDGWKKGDRNGLIEYLLNTRQTLLIPDGFEKNVQEKNIIIAPDQGLPLCYLGVPIKRKNEVYGVIAVQDFRETNTLRASDKAVIEALSVLIGLQMD